MLLDVFKMEKKDNEVFDILITNIENSFRMVMCRNYVLIVLLLFVFFRCP